MYLFTEGDASSGSQEMLKRKVTCHGNNFTVYQNTQCHVCLLFVRKKSAALVLEGLECEAELFFLVSL